MSERQIALLLGSDSDMEKLQGVLDICKELQLGCEVRVLSAHRTPEDLREYVLSAEKNGIKVILAAAGGAAHLAGTVAALTRLPVLGIPIDNPPFAGLDSLLSTVQMPGGVPVATFGVGSAGATNAALFAARILALNNPQLKKTLESYKEKMRDKVRQKDKKLRQQLG